jgi:hypothetical protein
MHYRLFFVNTLRTYFIAVFVYFFWQKMIPEQIQFYSAMCSMCFKKNVRLLLYHIGHIGIHSFFIFAYFVCSLHFIVTCEAIYVFGCRFHK